MGYFRDLLKNIDLSLLILPLIFAVISVIMIGSTSYDTSFHITREIKVQLIAYALGVIAITVILLFDYKTFESLEKVLFIGSIVMLLLVYMPGISKVQFGAHGWISLGPLDFQPSELVKITFVLSFASYLSRNRKTLDNLKGFLKAALYFVPFVLLILIEPDLGNAIVVFVIAFVMLFCAGTRYKLFGEVAGVGIVSLPVVYRFMEAHQKIRIDAFLNPDNLSLPGNYQVWNSKIAIGSGGFFGKGLFHGTQKELKFLPVQESDFIFSVIVEELGFIGGALVVALYTFFLYRIVKIADNAKDMYGSLVVIGILSMFAFQIFENIAMTMGLMPVTGITLPFISYGGSSVLTNMIALGIVLNVGIRSKVINF
ncbi:MAG: rod shape-determining protein RodA [Eubacteriales bacterium]